MQEAGLFLAACLTAALLYFIFKTTSIDKNEKHA
jgi:hypothetical protein